MLLLPISSLSLFGQLSQSSALGKSCCPTDTRNTEVCAQPICAILLIYCKSSSHAHQLWYQVQTILTQDFIVVTAYNRLPLTHSLWAYAVQQQLIKHFSIEKHDY